MVTGMDGIVFWGPLLIHTIMDGDSGSGDAPHAFILQCLDGSSIKH